MSTIQSLLSKTSALLDTYEAELLLAHVLQTTREYIIAHPEKHVSPIGAFRFQRLISKRKNNIPIAYLTGHKEFYGLDFLVTTATLVPRGDTELLVELAVKELATTPAYTFIDIGTGSGCIPIAIMDTIKPRRLVGVSPAGSTRKHFFATDISKRAIRVAKKNAKLHDTDITFLHGNLLEPCIKPLTNYRLSPIDYRLIITANLPYLTMAQYEEEPSIHHEPIGALVAANHCLALYEKLFEQLHSLLEIKDTPIKQVSVFFEIDPTQATQIRTLLTQFFPNAISMTHQDLSGNIRVVAARMGAASVLHPQQLPTAIIKKQ